LFFLFNLSLVQDVALAVASVPKLMAKIVSKSQNARNYVVRIFLKKQKAEKFKFIQVFFHV